MAKQDMLPQNQEATKNTEQQTTSIVAEEPVLSPEEKQAKVDNLAVATVEAKNGDVQELEVLREKLGLNVQERGHEETQADKDKLAGEIIVRAEGAKGAVREMARATAEKIKVEGSHIIQDKVVDSNGKEINAYTDMVKHLDQIPLEFLQTNYPGWENKDFQDLHMALYGTDEYGRTPEEVEKHKIEVQERLEKDKIKLEEARKAYEEKEALEYKQRQEQRELEQVELRKKEQEMQAREKESFERNQKLYEEELKKGRVGNYDKQQHEEYVRSVRGSHPDWFPKEQSKKSLLRRLFGKK